MSTKEIEKRLTLLGHCMLNPCLSEPIDYEPDNVRLTYYAREIASLSEEALNEQLDSIEL